MTVPVEVPLSGRPGLLRARLLTRLQERWSSKVVTVTAGPGFGKTTLLAQACTENLLDPRGIDVWLSARPSHSGAEALARDLAGTLGAPERVGPVGASELAALITARAPNHISVFLDDAHLVGVDSDGARLIGSLVAELPANGHLVLGGRSPQPIGVARLVVQGAAVQIDERELAFDDEEATAFAALRLGRPERVAASGGWPAMAELLVLARGEEMTVEFLWEEVLAELPDERRRQLAVLTAIGGADDDRLSAAVGTPVVVGEVVRNLPMTSRTTDGWVTLHDLWRPALRRVLDPGERARYRHSAAADALDRGDLATAFALYAVADAWDDARSVVARACSHTHPLVPFDVLQDWLRRLRSANQGHHPEAALLVGVLVRQSDPPVSAQHFELAARQFRAEGDHDREASCLFQLGQIHWWHDNTEALAALVGRLVELATGGSSLAASVLDLAPMLAGPAAPERPDVDFPGRVPVPTVHPEVVPLRSWLLARDHLYAGDGELALHAARAAAATVTPSMQAVSEFLVLQCLWAIGRRDEVINRLGDCVDAVVATKLDYFAAADLAMASLWLSTVGEADASGHYRERARSVSQRTSVWADVLVGLTGVVALLDRGGDGAAGDGAGGGPVGEGPVGTGETAAAGALRELLLRAPLQDPSSDLAHRPWLAVSYVLDRASRPHWDESVLRGSLAAARRAAGIIVAWRESGDLGPAREAVNLECDLVLATQPSVWAGELAAVMAAAGHRETADRLLGSATEPGLRRLKEVATGPRSTVSAAAAELSGSAGRRANATVTIQALGALQILRDGVPSSAPELSRRRVRELLLLLVEHGTLSRDRIIAMMWPDLEEKAGRANLRTTLSYLNKVLEPHRPPREDPYFVVEHADRLQLREDPDLEIDVRRFDALLSEAADLERAGAVSSAHQCLLSAVARYRGPYLADATAEWADGPRDRCRLRFCNAAVRAGELSVATGDAATAEALARRVVEAEPWSEAAHRLLAETRLAQRDRAGAHRAYAACLAMLAELGAEPTSETVMLGRRLSSGRGSRTPAQHTTTV